MGLGIYKCQLDPADWLCCLYIPLIFFCMFTINYWEMDVIISD